ncbi:hypothetical protein [Jeotgalibacillus soli]|uniref:hypothetical protein n=1 Tax=Jeotgalibacillus soli TaxID=889306 RepID=UPI00103F7947|nr:hypothetical protein [Jeotgalibacillus soli]
MNFIKTRIFSNVSSIVCYVKNNSIAENPAAADFIPFAINKAGEMAKAVGRSSIPKKYTMRIWKRLKH